MMPIKLKITINLSTPLHVGGEPGADVNTAYILRGADGLAYYPGTAFKGKVRHYALQLQKGNCKFPYACDCDVCRLFGGEGNAPGELFFSNFHVVGEQATDFRAGNAIDRYRRVADDKKLFTTESAAISVLEGYITGNVKNDELDSDNGDATSKDVRLLKESIKLIRQIGGNTSRGFGWVKNEIAVEVVGENPADQSKKATSNSESGIVACVSVALKPESPLLIGTHTTQSNFRDTQRIIPGAVLRAALARAICQQDGTSDPSENGIKEDMPKDRDSKFPNLRKAFSELRFSALHSDMQPEPYPITTRKCKYNAERKDHTDIGRFDNLALLLSDAWNNGKTKGKCPLCGERLEKVDPYEDFDSREFHKLTVTSTHSEMDKLRGTSRDGRLFTVRAISKEATVFRGTISGEVDYGELSHLSQSPLRVGAMLTTGFGECEMTVDTVSETRKDDLVDRIKRFNTLVDSEDIFAPITLLSEAIVKLSEPDDGDYYKAYERLVNQIEEEPHFEIAHVITKPRMWRGFDTRVKSQNKGCEKDARYIMQAGSVLVVKIRAPDDPATVAKLMRLEREGIGNETKDGYGAVRIAHERHIKNAIHWKEEICDD